MHRFFTWQPKVDAINEYKQWKQVRTCAPCVSLPVNCWRVTLPTYIHVTIIPRKETYMMLQRSHRDMYEPDNGSGVAIVTFTSANLAKVPISSSSPYFSKAHTPTIVQRCNRVLQLFMQNATSCGIDGD